MSISWFLHMPRSLPRGGSLKLQTEHCSSLSQAPSSYLFFPFPVVSQMLAQFWTLSPFGCPAAHIMARMLVTSSPVSESSHTFSVAMSDAPNHSLVHLYKHIHGFK